MGQLDGRVVIVTGASRGIGAAIAERMAAEGASLAVTARTLEDDPRIGGSLRRTVERCERHGAKVTAIQADLAKAEDRARIAATAAEQLGTVDVLVNNAAAAIYQPLMEMSEKRFRLVYEVNLMAPWDLSRAVVPGMRERGAGSILNISSATSDLPEVPGNEFHARGGAAVYGSSKAALERYSVGFAAELYDDGIDVNSMAPVAAVRTEGAEAVGVVPDSAWDEAESVEAMAEAALALCVPRDPRLTGRVTYCTPLLEELGIPIRSLDGKSAAS